MMNDRNPTANKAIFAFSPRWILDNIFIRLFFSLPYDHNNRLSQAYESKEVFQEMDFSLRIIRVGVENPFKLSEL